MKFNQIGTLTETQKAAIKASAMFKRFLKVAQNKGAEEIKIVVEAHKTYVNVYAEARNQECFYWVEVGSRGGLTDESYKAA
jgi:hypothetical protein